MTKRPTAREYKEEMQDLLNKTERLQQIVVTRLYTLCANHPDAVIAQQGDTDIKAKSLLPQNRSKDYIKDLGFENQIHYIAVIEAWLASQHPHKQTTIQGF